MRSIIRLFFFPSPAFCCFIFLLPAFACWKASAQDWVRTGTNLGAARIRLAAADFNPVFF